jgi:hypothetical protein
MRIFWGARARGHDGLTPSEGIGCARINVADWLRVTAAKERTAPTAIVALILPTIESTTICRIDAEAVARTDGMRSYTYERGT